MAGRIEITKKELEFAKLIGEYDLTPVEAARKVFSWRAEPGTSEAQKARDLARNHRIRYVIDGLRNKRKARLETEISVNKATKTDIKSLHEFLILKLKAIRNNTSVNSRVRYQAIEALEKLKDPSTDLNLIMKWVEVAWSYTQAHCPACHNSFPLEKVKNAALDEFRGYSVEDYAETTMDRRMNLFRKADARKTPHPSQLRALAAPERNIVVTAPARAGKSWTSAMMALGAFLLPGVEIWILSRVYEDSLSEAEYLKNFLKTIFYPNHEDIIKIYEDKKNGELSMFSRWGSVLKLRSAKSKGSISGRELEMAIVAEPGWVPDDIYHHLRARMVSRLGRIVALGTPQNIGGFLGRLIRTTGRDPETGKIIRFGVNDRLISNGCPWNQSMLIYTMDPLDNPEYVASEQQAARMEMTDSEFATEFRGEQVSVANAKFPYLSDSHLVKAPLEFFRRASFVLGIDQGPTNFGACLIAYDGDLIVPCYEYFDNTTNTMKANLKILSTQVPRWLAMLGATVPQWKLTTTDRDPPLWQTFMELQEDGLTWPTEQAERHTNRRGQFENWRKENTEFLNNMCQKGKLLWHVSDVEEPVGSSAFPGAVMLFDQMRTAIDRPENPLKESGKDDVGKGWVIKDPWRGDHVADAFYFALWSIYSGQVPVSSPEAQPFGDAYKEANAGLQFLINRAEKEELSGFSGGVKFSADEEIFRRFFGRERSGPKDLFKFSPVGPDPDYG